MNQSGRDRQEMVRSFKDAGFIPEITVMETSQLCDGSGYLAGNDLIILDAAGVSHRMDEICIKLEKAEGKGKPLIFIISDKKEKRFISNSAQAECLFRRDIRLIGKFARHLLQEADLYKRLKSAESVGKRETERLKATLSSIGDGVITTNIYGHVTFMNPAAEELTGWNQQEAKGVHIDEVFKIINKETREELESPFILAMKEGTKIGLKRSTALLSKDGHEYFVSASNSPLRDSNGTIIGFITVFRDITRIKGFEKELEEGQKSLKAIYNAAPVSMLIIDEKARVQNVNDSFLKTFFMRSDEVINKRFGTVLGCEENTDDGKSCGEGRSCHTCKLRKALDGVISSSTPVKGLELKKVLNVDHQVAEYYFRINAVPLSLNETKYAVVVIDDITQYINLKKNLLKSRDHYLTLFEKFPALIWRAGRNKKCNYFNQSWLDFTGRTMDQEAGDGWLEGVHSEDVEMCIKVYSEAFDAKEPFEMEYRLRNKEGQYRWIVDIGRPFHDLDGMFLGYIGTCFDITERKIAEEGLQRYQLLSQKANDIILFADINGCVIEANEAALRAFGYGKEEILGKQIFYLVSPDPKLPIGIHPHQSNPNGIYYEATAYRSDGSLFTAEVSLQGTEISDSRVLMAILRDTTERKRINEELRRAKESAEAANRAKSEFLANMSHEIRTPLNGMMGMIDLTLITDLTEEQKDNLHTAKECASTLLKVINDILDFSKIEAGKLSIESIDFSLVEYLEKAVKPHRIKAHEKGLQFTSEIDDMIPKMVNGDPYRLKQVMDNLLGNAVKFTDSGEISLIAKLISNNHEYTELGFQVSDTGIGIAEEDMPSLFSAFSQVDRSHTRKYGGTGLGLAISRQLVERMDGSIWVESMKEKGSTFFFTIKLRNGDKADTRDIIATSVFKTENPRHILLVEDDKVNQFVISRMIEETGHKILTADNGKEALQILGTHSVDMVLMDIQMPVMGGLEATSIIREKEKTSGEHLPIIALTAFALQGDRERFLAAGMDDYISKPIQMRAFLDTVERMTLGRGQQKDTLVSKEYDTAVSQVVASYEQKNEQICKDTQEALEGLNHSFERKDWAGVERCAHKIKILSSETGDNPVKIAAFKVELAARKNSVDDVTTNLARITEALLKHNQAETCKNINEGR